MEFFAQIARYRSDIGASRASDIDDEFGHLPGACAIRNDVDIVDFDEFGIDFDVATISHDFVGASTVDVNGRIIGGRLPNFTAKIGERRAYSFDIDVFIRRSSDDIAFGVVGRRLRTDANRRAIRFRIAQKKLQHTRRATEGDDENARCQRIECSTVPKFNAATLERNFFVEPTQHIV